MTSDTHDTGAAAGRGAMDIGCTCSALRMAARRMTQLYDAALAPEGLTVSQYAVLGNLGRGTVDPCGEGPTMTALAERLGLDRTTLAHNLRLLERDGFVAVAPDGLDKRLRRVTLTARGRAKRERCQPLWRAAQERFEAGFGPDASRQLRASLVALARRADLEITQAAPAAGGD